MSIMNCKCGASIDTDFTEDSSGICEQCKEKSSSKYQTNKITGLAYQGRNQGELLTAKEQNGYKSNEWLTFLQAKSLNLRIKRGSRSVSVFKGFGSFTDKDEKDGKIKTNSAPLGFAHVFSIDQTEEANK